MTTDGKMMEKLGEIVSLAVYFEAVGVVYSIVFFGLFGLNFADFTELNDLFLGLFKEPAIFVAALVVVGLIAIPRRKKSGVMLGLALAFVPLASAATMAVVAHYYITSANRAMPFSNTGTEVRVYLAEGHRFLEEDQKIDSARFLGTSGDYFFFDEFRLGSEVRRNVMVIPSNQIVQIRRERALE